MASIYISLALELVVRTNSDTLAISTVKRMSCKCNICLCKTSKDEKTMSPSRDRDHQKISFTSAMLPKKAKVKKGAVKKKFAKKPAKKPAASPVPHTLGRSEFAPSAFEKSKEKPLCGVIARDCHGAHAGIPGSKKLQSVWRDAMENTYGENVARQAQENVALGMNCWHLKMEVHHSYDANNEEQDLETNMIAFLPTTKLPAEFKSLDEMPCEHPFDAYILVRGADARETAQSFVSSVCTKHGGKEDGESYKIGDGLITIFKNYPEELKTAVEDLQTHEFKYKVASPLTLKTHAGTEERTAKYDCITTDSVSDEVKKVADLADVKVIGYPDNPKWLHDSTPKFMKVSVGGTVHSFNLRVRACRLLRHRFLGSLPNRRDEDHMSDSQELSDAEVERLAAEPLAWELSCP